jgi:hypothetical protein
VSCQYRGANVPNQEQSLGADDPAAIRLAVRLAGEGSSPGQVEAAPFPGWAVGGPAFKLRAGGRLVHSGSRDIDYNYRRLKGGLIVRGSAIRVLDLTKESIRVVEALELQRNPCQPIGWHLAVVVNNRRILASGELNGSV